MMLSLQVQSLGASPDDHQFKPVEVSYDMLRTGDTPTRVFSLDPLPVVAVITALGGAYFFEFNTGALLFSTETLGSSSQGYPLLPQWQDGKGFHLPGRDGVSTWVTVNEKDLIGWVRQVLKNDTLASLIAVRTGLPGAHDITMHDMFRNYTHISRASTLDNLLA
ncbi:hypothetical protein FRC02_011833 [Tulasnella sp. 418]|nr:hypothetical protein FRC02_011833 [Tulasnella sp. 418]